MASLAALNSAPERRANGSVLDLDHVRPPDSARVMRTCIWPETKPGGAAVDNQDLLNLDQLR
jgi:hypothetical protein